MSDREDQLRREAAAMADAVGRELDGAFLPLAEHARRVRDMAVELTLIASRASRRAERLSADAGVAEPAFAELLALSEVVRSLAGEVRAMSERSVLGVDELKGQIVQAVRGAVLDHRRRDRFDVDGETGERGTAAHDGGSDH